MCKIPPLDLDIGRDSVACAGCWERGGGHISKIQISRNVYLSENMSQINGKLPKSQFPRIPFEKWG